MRNATAAFKRALADGRRDYKNRAVITLADGTVLTGTKTTVDEDTGVETVEVVNYLTNENIWTDGLSMEDAVSNDNIFQIGAAIINQGKVVINNIHDEYTEYDFTGATVVLYVGLDNLDDGSSDEVKMGTFTVDSADYDMGTITLTCLDYMAKFDKPYEGHSTYPLMLTSVINNCCTKCGVERKGSNPVPHGSLVMQNPPSGESTTYRQVLSWAAQIAGCYARCDADGRLVIKFYDFAGLDEAQDNLDGGSFDSGTPTYSTGDDADGGSLNPWSTGYEYDAGGFVGGPKVHLINSDFSSKIALDDVVITEVRVVEKVDTTSLDTYANAFSESGRYGIGEYVYYGNNLYRCIKDIYNPGPFNSSYWEQVSTMTYTSGTPGYAIVIDGNDLVSTGTGQTIADMLATDLVGITFRPANITHPSDPTIEAGDVGLFWDRKGNRHPIIISSTNFTSGSSQNTVSSAETPARNSAQRFTQATANYVAMREQMAKDEGYLSREIANSNGLYSTTETDTSVTPPASITYYHDKPLKSDSNIVMMFSTVGFTMTADYQTPQSQGGPTWYGMTVDGQFIAGILSASGVNADWINAGTISAVDIHLGDTDNVDGRMIVSVPSNSTYVTIDDQGIYCYDDQFQDFGTAIEYGIISLDNGDAELTSFGEDGDYALYPFPRFQFIAYDDGAAVTYEKSNGTLNGLLVNNSGIYCHGGFTVMDGQKNRAVDVEDGSTVVLSALETPTPYFNDIGTARISNDGSVVVDIDDVFLDTINANIEYCVFLQKEGEGDLWVSEKAYNYFAVNGTPGLKFSWELKAVQKGYEDDRLNDLGLSSNLSEIDENDGLSRMFDEELRQSDREMESLFALDE